jgi:hypothetical protein
MCSAHLIVGVLFLRIGLLHLLVPHTLHVLRQEHVDFPHDRVVLIPALIDIHLRWKRPVTSTSVGTLRAAAAGALFTRPLDYKLVASAEAGFLCPRVRWAFWHAVRTTELVSLADWSTVRGLERAQPHVMCADIEIRSGEDEGVKTCGTVFAQVPRRGRQYSGKTLLRGVLLLLGGTLGQLDSGGGVMAEVGFAYSGPTCDNSTAPGVCHVVVPRGQRLTRAAVSSLVNDLAAEETDILQVRSNHSKHNDGVHLELSRAVGLPLGVESLRMAQRTREEWAAKFPTFEWGTRGSLRELQLFWIGMTQSPAMLHHSIPSARAPDSPAPLTPFAASHVLSLDIVRSPGYDANVSIPAVFKIVESQKNVFLPAQPTFRAPSCRPLELPRVLYFTFLAGPPRAHARALC